MVALSKISRRRRLSRRGSPGVQAGMGCAAFFTLGLVAVLFALTYGFASVVQGLPSIESLPVLLDPPNGLLLQPTRLYDRSGQTLLLSLDNPLGGPRTYLNLDANQIDYIPDVLAQATLAASQPDFRASPGYALSGLLADTHPTLAQRLVFDLLLRNEAPGLRRSLRERFLAGQLTARFGRDKILEWFLNSSAYGPQVYGVMAAAQAYFDKPPEDLTLAEAALLAALAELPEVDPAGLPTLLVERQKAVLERMLENGQISPAQALEALTSELHIRPAQAADNLAPALTRLALAQLRASLPQVDAARGGLRLYTTLDFHLQQQAECTLQAELASLAGSAAPAGSPACPAARLLPTLDLAPLGQAPAGGLILLDPANGQVLALASAPAAGMDASAAPGRPAGSLLTPLIYLTAFSRGFTPASLFWDVPGLSPANSGARDYFGPLRLRTALVNDDFGPAAQLLAQLGRDSVQRTAGQLGLPGGAGQFNSPLDTGSLSLLDAAQLYALFANQGLAAGQPAGGGQTAGGQTPGGQTAALQPSALLRVERVDGQALLDWSKPNARPLISGQLAYLVNNVLSDEAARWPSLGHPNSLEIGRLAAAKLGQTASGEDGWALGYTPHWVAGAWLGSPEAPKNHLLTRAAAALWHAFSQYISQDQPSDGWSLPAGVSKLNVCDPSGMLPTAICPAIVSEVFLEGTQPTQADSLYRTFQVNHETGRLATVFTPPELIEDRVYLVAPPEAAQWAQQKGLPTPPNTYDVIYSPPANPGVQITQPELFAHVHGTVRFTGSAGGADFQFFRLQVGQGLNPQTWLQLGEDTRSPVQDGALGTWDTRGLSGLYAVQLLVVHRDQRVERAVTQLTVDNQPPVVQVLSPGPQTSILAGSSLVLQASASDDLQLARVDFFIDKQLVGSLVQGPFNLAWQAQRGSHTLLVKAYDLAGNLSQSSAAFTVK